MNSATVTSVVFFNKGHNGDVFYSKEFTRFFAKKLGINAFHYHNRCQSIVSDLNLPFISDSMKESQSIPNWQVPMHVEGDVLFVNTWIAQGDGRWHRDRGCTLHDNYRMFSHHAETLGFSLPKEEWLFIPEIDYGHYGVDNFILPTERNVFISNGPVLSGQTVNWDMTGMIANLSKRHPACTFHITHPINISFPNVIDANRFFDFGGRKSNLNELSKLASLCDIIVGRASGPFCFTHTKANLLDRNKTFICSSNGKEEGLWVVMDDYDVPEKAKQVWQECHVHKHIDCTGEVFALIHEEVNSKYGSG
jgi:hypothetical protein